jgi:hypothetical protein
LAGSGHGLLHSILEVVVGVGEPLATGTAEGLTITVISYIALPRMLYSAQEINDCFRLLRECGRLAHHGAAEVRAGHPERSPEGYIAAVRWELGRAIKKAFGKDDRRTQIDLLLGRFAKQLVYAEEGLPVDADVDGCMLIREHQMELKDYLERRARRHASWRLFRLAKGFSSEEGY